MRSHDKVSFPSPDETLFLVDSSIYVYRAWHLTPKSINDPQGMQINAVHGFAEFLLQLIAQTRARFLVCAFDHPSRPTVRHTLYPAYKSGRSTTPPQLRQQFPLCQKLVGLMGIQEMSVCAYEADDIIDTLAHIARKDNKKVCVVSADKDLTQCIGEADVYWDFAKKVLYNHRSLVKRFGVKPGQMADLLALSGDKVDDIPGVPGVGPSTAARLLKKWGNLDILFTHLDQAASMKFRGAKAVAALLVEHEQLVRRSRQISGLFHIEELAQAPNDFRRTSVDTKALTSFLSETGFDEGHQARILSAVEATQ